MATFKKATKKQARLRAAIYGPSGSGKTYSALRIAKGMGGSIAVIDTERGSASKYSDQFDFDVCELEICNIQAYINAIEEAKDYDILIIDSLSHAWQELLEEISILSNSSKYKGNDWRAWSEGTPKQKKFVNSILRSNSHIIVTMRSSTEWATQDSNGKKTISRIGLKPEQGKGIEYEFDLLLNISTDHICTIEKDRTGKFQDKTINLIDEKFGKKLADWLNVGVPIDNDDWYAKLYTLHKEKTDQRFKSKSEFIDYIKSTYQIMVNHNNYKQSYESLFSYFQSCEVSAVSANPTTEEKTETTDLLGNKL
jgi:hypothetical protein